MVFREDAQLRFVDLDVTLKALVDTKFGDTKDGAFLRSSRGAAH